MTASLSIPRTDRSLGVPVINTRVRVIPMSKNVFAVLGAARNISNFGGRYFIPGARESYRFWSPDVASTRRAFPPPGRGDPKSAASRRRTRFFCRQTPVFKARTNDTPSGPTTDSSSLQYSRSSVQHVRRPLGEQPTSINQAVDIVHKYYILYTINTF